MNRCVIRGGYDGKFGTITACRSIELPCNPFPDLVIILDGQRLSVESNEQIEWCVRTGTWALYVWDIGDNYFPDCKSVQHIIEWYEGHGWNVEDSYEAVPNPTLDEPPYYPEST